ncbi:hypothetical protein [Streptomyces mirabilis]|jgi:hypothetical protein|uniref:Uncharacterized protein n=1 Tax=Streptomyces mirabilis TaxID=68239 RepID=A0A1I2HBU5_9ACTN|nr:hypothetical protein [Streptomyces mirabilis]SFF27725.1 hypothetical protein SAMN02787118_10578 [Streptomyces mirabilis]
MGVHMGFVGVEGECAPDVVERLVDPVGVQTAFGSYEQHPHGIRGDTGQEMPLLNHNGIDLGSKEEVDEAHMKMQEVKDDSGIRQLTSPVLQRGTYSFPLQDRDGKRWEICYLPPNGYEFRFDSSVDLTGHEELSGVEIRSRLQLPLEH